MVSAVTRPVEARIAEIEARHRRTSGTVWAVAPLDESTKADLKELGPYVFTSMWGAVACCPRKSPQFSNVERNMAFIAHAHQDVPWLIGELRDALAREAKHKARAER